MTAYLLFPRNDILTALGVVPVIDALDVTGRTIYVRTQGPEFGDTVFQFDLDLRLVEARLADGFANVHEQFRRRGLIVHSLTPAELDELRKVQRFATTPNGNLPEVDRFWKTY